jgi:hypothetical protein
MSRILSLLVGGLLTLGLIGCDVDVDDREPDVIDTPDTIINEDRDPGADVNVDDDPDVSRPGVDVDVDTNPPTTGVPDVDVDVERERTTPDRG